MDIAILTQTYKRTEYLKRLAKSLEGFEGAWIVSDACPSKENESIVTGSQCMSEYIEQPEASRPEMMHLQRVLMLKKASFMGADKIIFCNDDDLVNIPSLSNFDVPGNLVMGVRIDFFLHEAYNNIEGYRACPYPYDFLTSDEARKRWIGWLKAPFSVEYALVSTELALEIYKTYPKDDNVFYYGDEAFANLYLLAKEPVVLVDDVLTYQQKHIARPNPFKSRTLYNSLCDPNWTERFERVRHHLYRVMDREFVDESLFFHIKCMARGTWEALHSTDPQYTPSNIPFEPTGKYKDQLMWLKQQVTP